MKHFTRAKVERKPLISEECQANELGLIFVAFSDKSPYFCKLCSKGFTASSSLRTHERSLAHREKLEEVQRNLKNERIIPENNANKCDICNKTIREPIVLQAHRKRCEDLKKLYNCETCNLPIHGKIMLEVHQYEKHYENPNLKQIAGDIGKKHALEKYDRSHSKY